MKAISKFLINRNLSFVWRDSKKNIKIKIEIPNLTKNNYEVWGDWGPMYSVELDKEQPITVEIFDKINDTQKSYKIETGKIHLYSPSVAEERKATPFFLKFEETINRWIIRIYFDNDSIPVKYEIYDLEKKKLLFESSPCSKSIRNKRLLG